MPWIEQLRVLDGRTIQPKQYESAKAEREMIISFAPGELKTDDLPTINRYYHDMGQIVKIAVEEELGTTASKPASPASPPKDMPAKSAPATPTTPAASKPAAPPKKDEKPAAAPKKEDKPAEPAKDDKATPETVEGESAFDRNKPGWIKCPRCGNTEINAETEKENAKTGKKWIKKYQACFECGIFLNFDGKVVEMAGWEQQEGKGAKA